jgi:hypothetical protein
MGMEKAPMHIRLTLMDSFSSKIAPALFKNSHISHENRDGWEYSGADGDIGDSSHLE